MFDQLPEPEEIANPSARMRMVAVALAAVFTLGLAIHIGRGRPGYGFGIVLGTAVLFWGAHRWLTNRRFYYFAFAWALVIGIVRIVLKP